MALARLAAPCPGSPLRPEGARAQLRLDREVRRPRRLDLRDVEVADQTGVEARLRQRRPPVVDVQALDPAPVLLRQLEHPLDRGVLALLAELEQRAPVGQHELGDPAGLREPHLTTHGPGQTPGAARELALARVAVAVVVEAP